jgi:hypothetical protein
MKSPSLSGLSLTPGTTMQVVEDNSPDSGSKRQVKVLVLEGAHFNERLDIARSKLGNKF